MIPYRDTPHPLTPVTTDRTIQTQKQSSPAGLNMTTTVDVVCPRCQMADFSYVRCTTCKYFAIHQLDTPDMVPRHLYGVMSPDTLYPRQGSWQDAEVSPTTHTCSAPPPQETTPNPIPPNDINGWVHDVTKDGDVEPNPGPTSPAGPSPKRMRNNRDDPPTYNTPRMLRKRTTEGTWRRYTDSTKHQHRSTPPGNAKRRTHYTTNLQQNDKPTRLT